MKIRSVHSALAVSLLSMFALATSACGAKQEAKAPESDPWAGFQGTYADAAPQKSGKAEKKVADAAPAPKADKAKEEPAAAAAPAKKTSKMMIKGESISSIGSDALAAAAGSNLKSKVVSSDVTVGPQYELVSVQLKGQSIQIVRPAASPDPSGMALPGPKERNGELSKTESGMYDADADVLVIVNSAQKKVSKTSLGQLMKK